jgi:hypothetical protein
MFLDRFEIHHTRREKKIPKQKNNNKNKVG